VKSRTPSSPDLPDTTKSSPPRFIGCSELCGRAAAQRRETVTARGGVGCDKLAGEHGGLELPARGGGGTRRLAADAMGSRGACQGAER
jgi:hypothetical protein